MRWVVAALRGTTVFCWCVASLSAGLLAAVLAFEITKSVGVSIVAGAATAGAALGLVWEACK